MLHCTQPAVCLEAREVVVGGAKALTPKVSYAGALVVPANCAYLLAALLSHPLTHSPIVLSYSTRCSALQGSACTSKHLVLLQHAEAQTKQTATCGLCHSLQPRCTCWQVLVQQKRLPLAVLVPIASAADDLQAIQ